MVSTAKIVNQDNPKKVKVGTIFLCFIFGVVSILFNDDDLSKKAVPQNEIDLGKLLFFDTALSKDQSISCASCHNPKFAFADSIAFSKGINETIGIRNTPSIMNMAFRPYFFYDGRAATLQEQILIPIENPIEMHLPYAEAVKRISDKKDYQTYFKSIYNTPPDSTNILNAITAFIQSLESNGSAPHDVWVHGDETILTESQKRGHTIFTEKGKCFDCHFGPDFTGDEFRNIGLYDEQEFNDKGRFEITKDSSDLGKFKVPGLRNITLTAPYMHNGMFQTLEEVIDYYDNPYETVKNPINIDTLLLKPLHLTEQEKTDLLNFMQSFTDTTFPF